MRRDWRGQFSRADDRLFSCGEHYDTTGFPAMLRHSPRTVQRVWFTAIACGMVLGVGCERTPEAAAPKTTVQSERKVPSLRPEAIGAKPPTTPWIAHVFPVDLDRDGRLDVIACEAQANQVLWLRQTETGSFEERVIATGMKAPVHAEVVDFDGDGDLDVVVASMGFVFPNNDRIGTVFVLENDGRQNFTPHVLLENIERVTDVRAGDFNGDGKLDLALAQFGYDQGSVSWLERTGPWEFKRHVLLALSGAVNVGVADFNGDGRPDIVALVSQQWEEVHYFENQGSGKFSAKRLWGSTNEDYGSSGLTVGDLNGDGRPDVLFSNGDGFGPSVEPGPRPWHGVQWLENLGAGKFRYHRIGDLPGAYSPVAVDLDSDGAMDVVAVAAYAGRGRPAAKPASLLWFRNVGRMKFEPHVLATAPQDQITLAVGKFSSDGRAELVSGGFYLAATYDGTGRITLWRR
jgi:hypothetical protein